jgi:toxin ParE1/3/4
MDFELKITLQARRDIRNIWQFIARDDIQVTDSFCAELFLAASSLQNFPHRHGSLARRPNIRKFPYGSYLIFYKIDEDSRLVEVLRFWHGARNQNRLRLKEESAGYALAASPAL